MPVNDIKSGNNKEDTGADVLPNPGNGSPAAEPEVTHNVEREAAHHGIDINAWQNKEGA